jgi:hypothetical protein
MVMGSRLRYMDRRVLMVTFFRLVEGAAPMGE